jgi:hypothetical protein
MLMVSMRVPSCPFVATVFVRVSPHREQVAGKHQENEEKRRNVSADAQERQDEEQEQRQRATEQHPQAMSLHTFLVTCATLYRTPQSMREGYQHQEQDCRIPILTGDSG